MRRYADDVDDLLRRQRACGMAGDSGGGARSAAPEPGERAAGYGVNGAAIVAVPVQQPLAADGVWRVSLAGESVGRLVGRAREGGGGAWRLLKLDDLTDAQLDAYEVAMSGGHHDRRCPPAPEIAG